MRVSSDYRIYASLDRSAQIAVSQTLARTERGYEIDLVTPLVDRNDPVGGRAHRIQEVLDRIYPTPFEWLDEIERDRIEHIGPWSIMLPFSERKELVDLSFRQMDAQIPRAELEYAINKVASLVPRLLRPSSIDTAFQKMPKGTNQGYPFFQRGRKQEEGSLALARFTLSAGRIEFIPPAMLYWRGQPTGPRTPPKQRNVWGVAHFINILEEMFQIPVLEALRRTAAFSAWVHQDTVNESVTLLLDTAVQDVLSVDFSGFDRTVPYVLVHAAFEVIRTWFSSSWRTLIDELEKSFLTMGLWCPDGIRTDRSGGVPSGSTLTNLVDSLVQLIGFAVFEYRTRNQVLMSLVQGDDGVHSFAKPWMLQDIEEVFESFGMHVSSDKGGVSKSIVYFLQNVHSVDHRVSNVVVGVRPIFRVLNGMLSYERFHKDWNGYDDSIRWRQQALAAQYHPRFSQFVSWLWDNDKLSSLSLAQLVRKAGGVEAVKSALELSPFPHGKPSLQELGVSPVEDLLRSMSSEGGMRTRRTRVA